MTINVLVAVGFQRYEHLPELPRGVSDIEALAERFERDGFAVTAIPDRDREDLVKELSAVLRRDALDQPDTGLVVYWCGHATADAGAGGTVRLLARGNREDDPKAAVITADDLAELAALPAANQLLVLLDTCASGGALIDMVAVTDALQRRKLDTGARWVGLVASCQPHARAVDGAMAAKLLDLLEHGPNDERLRERWNVYQAHLRGDDLVDALQKEWDEDRQTPKVVNAGNARAFILNPLYNPNVPAEIVEHLRWASRGAAQTEVGNWFTGRVGLLRQIVAWMAANEPGLCVLNGPAGCGKSAVAGRIVALSDPEERSMIVSAQGAPNAEQDPGEGSVAANIQARGLTLERCAEQLGDALGVIGAARTPNQHDVLAWASSLQSPRTIVIDGLDEAGPEAFRIARELLAPLARYLLVLVASRELDGDESSPSLISVLGPAALSIDLDADPDATDRDVFDYVVARLTDQHGERVSVVMDPTLVAPQVVRLARAADQAGEGPFLLARILTSQLLADPADTAIAGWHDRLAVTVEEAFTRDLLASQPLTREGQQLPQAGRELLTALAYSYGPGFPADDVWPAAATALSPTGTAYTREDVFWALGEYGRYITASSLAGQSVYRLHQRVADMLRETEGSGALRRVPESTAAKLAHGLTHAYERALETGAAANEHPYLWLYGWRHASDGGLSSIDELERIAAHEPALQPDVAMSLNHLGIRYSEVGRRADAVAPTERAVEIREGLAAENPAFLPALAGSLHDLGVRYSEVGRRADAVAPTERAVEIREGLAAENPAFLPDLAGSLNSLGVRYGEVGRRADAVAPTERAVQIYEGLAAENPAFLNDLAGSLHNLGVRYSEVGRRADAVAPTERAVEIREGLAAENPAFLPDLAGSLNSLGVRYGEVGRRADAVAPTERAVQIYEGLAAENPAFLPALAGSLSNLGVRYGEVGRRADAVAPTERAVQIREGLAAENPAFLPDLAGSLSNLGIRYSQVGRRADAVAPTERAAEIREGLAAENPAFLPDLAGSLSNLGVRYSEVGRRADAVAPTERAAEIYEGLAAENPAFLPALAGSLHNLGIRYGEVGRRADAVAPTERAAEIREGLAAENPAFLPDLAGSLSNLGIRYGEVGRRADAVAPTERAAEIREGLAAENPAFLPDLASSLSNLGVRYSEVGRRADAVAPTERAVQIREGLAAENPAFLPDLAGSLSNLGVRYGEVGRRADAVAPTERAAEIREGLAAENPAFLPDLAGSLHNLGIHYSQVGRRADAVAPTERAAEIYEGLAAENPAFLPDLASSLNNLGIRYSETGDPIEGARRWEGVIDRFHGDALAGAILRIRRARRDDEFDTATQDLIEADELAADLGPNWIAELHGTCRTQRARDPERFDTLWEPQRGAVPDWLTLDDATLSTCAEWLNTNTWTDSRAHLVAHSLSILGHHGLTALAELALHYPDDPTIIGHQKLLETCRADGIDAAYRPLLVGETVQTWRSLADPGEAKQYLLDHRDDILTNEGHNALADEDLVGRAIITLARGNEIDLAYDLLTATDETRAAALADARRHAEAPKLHAIATLCAGSAQDDQALALALTQVAIAAALNGEANSSVELLREVRTARPVPELIADITDAITHRPQHAATLAPLVAAIAAP